MDLFLQPTPLVERCAVFVKERPRLYEKALAVMGRPNREEIVDQRIAVCSQCKSETAISDLGRVVMFVDLYASSRYGRQVMTARTELCKHPYVTECPECARRRSNGGGTGYGKSLYAIYADDVGDPGWISGREWRIRFAASLGRKESALWMRALASKGSPLVASPKVGSVYTSIWKDKTSNEMIWVSDAEFIETWKKEGCPSKMTMKWPLRLRQHDCICGRVNPGDGSDLVLATVLVD
jgi:hypothetical protein